MTEPNYERKEITVANDSISFDEVFGDNDTLEESISFLARKLGDLKAEYPGLKLKNEYYDRDYVTINVIRWENDEEFNARMQKYENNRQAKLLKQQNAEIKKAQNALKVASNAQLKEEAAEKEKALFVALYAKYGK